MKKLSIFLLSLLLLPLGVGAYSLSADECERLKEAAPLASASITVQPQKNGHVGCSALSTIGTGDSPTVIGVGLEIATTAEGSGIFDVFKDAAIADSASFIKSFCNTDATTCKEQAVVLDDTVLQSVKWDQVFGEGSGSTINMVEIYKGHIIALNYSHSQNSGVTQYPNASTEIMTVVKQMIDDRSSSGEKLVTHEEKKVSVTVVDVVGDVEVIPYSGSARPLEKGDTIEGGDRIYTSLDSYAVVRFADGHIARVNELSDLLVSHLGNDGDSIQTRLELKAGDIAVNIGISSTLKSDFNIKTPTATCSVRGTRFALSYDEESARTQLMVEEGAVEMESLTGSKELLSAGQQGSVGNDGVIALEEFTGSIEVEDSTDLTWLWMALVLVIVGGGVWKLKAKAQ